MADNSFNNTVESLFKGMDSFITTKTVVGDAIHIGDTIILPLVDVSFGVAAGAFSAEKKNNGHPFGCPFYLLTYMKLILLIVLFIICLYIVEIKVIIFSF